MSNVTINSISGGGGMGSSNGGYGGGYASGGVILDSSLSFTVPNTSYSNVSISAGTNYDYPIHTVEKDNKKIMLYELIGLSEDMLKIETEFINKTKTTYLNITGEFEDKLTGWKNDINIHERIDTDIYNGYETTVKDGILTVKLYEIINEEPKFFSYNFK